MVVHISYICTPAWWSTYCVGGAQGHVPWLSCLGNILELIGACSRVHLHGCHSHIVHLLNHTQPESWECGKEKAALLCSSVYMHHTLPAEGSQPHASSLPPACLSFCFSILFQTGHCGEEGQQIPFSKLVCTKSRVLVALTNLLSICSSSPDQRVASFCTLTDLQHGQELEGAPELSLCVDPTSGKEFMDTPGYVDPPSHCPKI